MSVANPIEGGNVRFQVNEGVQAREERFGIEGQNQRVWEIEYKGLKIGINFGTVAQAPTEAVLLPTGPELGLAAGAIENVLSEAAGPEIFSVYAPEALRMLSQIRTSGEEKSNEVALEYLNHLAEKTGLNGKRESGKQARNDLSEIAGILDNAGDEMSSGGSVPVAAGPEMNKVGIKLFILTNVRPLEGEKMSQSGMVQMTKSAAKAAELAGADSLTVPSIGTGMAAALGFGMSLKESMQGFFQAAKEYADAEEKTDNTRILKRLDYNMFYAPTEENLQGLVKHLDTLRITEIFEEKSK